MSKQVQPKIHRLTFLSLVAGISGACTSQAPLQSADQTSPVEDPVVESAPVPDQGPDVAMAEVETDAVKTKAEPAEVPQQTQVAEPILAVADPLPPEPEPGSECDPKLAPENCTDEQWDAWNAGE